jgi:hypothetical protein
MCAEAVTVPIAAAELLPSLRPASKPMFSIPVGKAIAFACACGNPLSAGSERAGSLAKCPSCGLAVVIPQVSTAAMAHSMTTTSRCSWEARLDPPSPDLNDEDDPEPDEADRQVYAAPKQRRPWTLAVLVLTGVLCTGAGASYLYRWWQNTTVGTDQQLKHEEAMPPPGSDGGRGSMPPTRETSLRDTIIQKNGLKLTQLVNAMLAYREKNGRLPPAAVVKNGKPLLSWRVALLPFLRGESAALYRQFDLEEPWDGPHNQSLLSRMPQLFALESQQGGGDGKTYFQVFVGPDAPFHGEDVMKTNDLMTGRLLIAEGAEPVPWTKPEDLPLTRQGPLPRLGHGPDGFLAAMDDGRVFLIPASIPEQTVRGLVTGVTGTGRRLLDGGR